MALLIGSIGTLVAAIAAAVASVIAVSRTGQIHNEVKTMNELTIGQLGERSETRRITAIEGQDRTAQERRHLAMAELDPHTRGVEKAIADRAQGGEIGTAKHDDAPDPEPLIS